MDVGALITTTGAADSGTPAPRAFGCSEPGCGRAFARKSDLVRHQRIHTGVKPFECAHPGCAKRFIQRSALNVHFRTHSGERPHTCDACDRSFSDSSSLARHRRTHTGVRPYGCAHPGCAKRFTRKTSLRKHMLTHGAAGAACRHSPSLSPILPAAKLLAPIAAFRAPDSPHGSASPTSTACSSPAMHGAEGVSLPPISALLR